MTREVELYADAILLSGLLMGVSVFAQIDPVFAMLWAGASCLITWLNG
jgi:hypothetical protein